MYIFHVINSSHRNYPMNLKSITFYWMNFRSIFISNELAWSSTTEHIKYVIIMLQWNFPYPFSIPSSVSFSRMHFAKGNSIVLIFIIIFPFFCISKQITSTICHIANLSHTRSQFQNETQHSLCDNRFIYWNTNAWISK